MNTSGVGLGLSTCKKIMEALSGSIHLNNEVTMDLNRQFSVSTSIAILVPCRELRETRETAISTFDFNSPKVDSIHISFASIEMLESS